MPRLHCSTHEAGSRLSPVITVDDARNNDSRRERERNLLTNIAQKKVGVVENRTTAPS
jgi:hypothetical protein